MPTNKTYPPPLMQGGGGGDLISTLIGLIDRKNRKKYFESPEFQQDYATWTKDPTKPPPQAMAGRIGRGYFDPGFVLHGGPQAAQDAALTGSQAEANSALAEKTRQEASDLANPRNFFGGMSATTKRLKTEAEDVAARRQIGLGANDVNRQGNMLSYKLGREQADVARLGESTKLAISDDTNASERYKAELIAGAQERGAVADAFSRFATADAMGLGDEEAKLQRMQIVMQGLTDPQQGLSNVTQRLGVFDKRRADTLALAQQALTKKDAPAAPPAPSTPAQVTQSGDVFQKPQYQQQFGNLARFTSGQSKQAAYHPLWNPTGSPPARFQSFDDVTNTLTNAELPILDALFKLRSLPYDTAVGRGQRAQIQQSLEEPIAALMSMVGMLESQGAPIPDYIQSLVQQLQEVGLIK